MKSKFGILAREVRALIVIAPAAAGLALAMLSPASADTVQAAAAKVNDAIISTWDLDQRVGMVLVSAGAPNTPEMRTRVRDQVLQQLVDEALQLQEGKRLNISVSADEIRESMEKVASQNNMSLEQIVKAMNSAGVKIDTFQAQIKAEITWAKIVNGMFGSRVNVSDEEVDETLKRMAESANKVQWQVAEIFIAVDSPEQEDQARKNIEQVLDQLRRGAPFPAIARQFSQSASAATGGDIGWITEGELPEELDKVLRSMRTNQISAPIRSAGGYYVLAVRSMRAPKGVTFAPVATSSLPPGVVKFAQVIVPLQGSGKEGMQRAAGIAQQLRGMVNSCASLREAAAQVRGVKVNSYPAMARKDIQEDLRRILADIPTGGSTPVLGSAEGAQFFVICDGGTAAAPTVETFEMPTREAVENRLYNQQLSSLARQYMRDLRRGAIIEIQ